MGSSNEPDPITWATDWDLPDDPSYIVTPTAGDQANGFDPLDTPPHSWINWAWNRFSRWVNYLATLVGGASDAYVSTGLTTIEVPNTTQVKVTVGTATAGGSQVEVTSIETITLPAVGTGSPGAYEYHILTIDSTGAISVTTSSTITTAPDDFVKDTKAAYQDVAQPAEALLSLVVDEGQAAYSTAYIYDLRQLKPISGAIVEAGSIADAKLRSAVAFPYIGDSVTTPTTAHRAEVDFKLIGYDNVDSPFLAIIPSNLRNGVTRISIRLHERVSSLTHVPSGLAFARMSPEQAPGQEVGIRVYDDTAAIIIAPDTWVDTDVGGVNFWEGEIDPTHDHTLYMYLEAGAVARDVVLIITTDHGITTSKTISLPANP